MKCGVCKSHMPIRSTAAVAEELPRPSAYMHCGPMPSCNNENAPPDAVDAGQSSVPAFSS